MDDEMKKNLLMDFEKNRQMLGGILQQKQHYSIQIEVINASLEELSKTKEKNVMKIVGNIMVQKSVEEMKKELEDDKETFDLKLKTVEKQEEKIVAKLNSLRAEIEEKKPVKEEATKSKK
ncbi:MAG: prefoldin subunit [Candidatus ainarchaeum sp.]|nr:prefoldin subunit [Candidatus ainarchaeum sp.]